MRKSRSREKKKRESIDESREPTFTSPHPVLQSEEGMSYSRVFPDTAVTFKHSTTPTKAKKQKGDVDLGVKPLTCELIPPTPMRMVAESSLPCTTATIMRPVPTPTSTHAWDLGAGGLQETNNDIQLNRKQTVCDFNQNVLMHTDQFGNPVLVQGMVEQPVAGSQIQTQQLQLPERQLDMNVTNQSLEALRANPFIQQLVEERVAVLESRMKSELQQGNQSRKKSGRYNIADTPFCASYLRWPNESYLSGSQRKRTAYDDLTLGHFVAGFITNVLDTQNVDTMKNMLRELGETVRLAENLSWPIVHGAFAISMHKIEDETLTWADTRTLADNRLTYSQSAVFSGSTTLSPKNTGSPQTGGGPKKIVCRWYNEGSCPHSQEHLDCTGTTLFRHICMYCHKYLKRSNSHVEADCFNKKTVVSE